MVTVPSYTAHSYLFLAVKQCAFVIMHAGSAVTFLTSRIFIFIDNMYDSGIREAENDLDEGLHMFGIRNIGLSL